MKPSNFYITLTHDICRNGFFHAYLAQEIFSNFYINLIQVFFKYKFGVRDLWYNFGARDFK